VAYQVLSAAAVAVAAVEAAVAVVWK